MNTNLKICAYDIRMDMATYLIEMQYMHRYIDKPFVTKKRDCIS